IDGGCYEKCVVTRSNLEREPWTSRSNVCATRSSPTRTTLDTFTPCAETVLVWPSMRWCPTHAMGDEAPSITERRFSIYSASLRSGRAPLRLTETRFTL